MRILVACEKSHRVAGAFRAKGHDAWSCDILPCEIETPYHIQDDVLKHLNDGWDMMIAHPDCTYLANSGVRWIFERPGRCADVKKAAEFFKKCLDALIPLIAIENPIQHKYARMLIRKPDQIIQPWWFGEGETKATCLWLKGLPPLMASYIHTDRVGRVWKEAPGPDRKANRSRTFMGIAQAMANQWGCLELSRPEK